eukprot:GFYU01011468.1.p1 GENE.GFYU01011468.1~~GFYU01011468.1.p1  ORF type:complete len:281 (-),score=36.89 GFYU01011468.1:113-955(-)
MGIMSVTVLDGPAATITAPSPTITTPSANSPATATTTPARIPLSATTIIANTPVVSTQAANATVLDKRPASNDLPNAQKKAKVPEKKFICEVEGCGKGYCSKSSLTKHTQSVHVVRVPPIDWTTVTDVPKLQQRIAELENENKDLKHLIRDLPKPPPPMEQDKIEAAVEKTRTSLQRKMNACFTYNSLKGSSGRCNVELSVHRDIFCRMMGDIAEKAKVLPFQYRHAFFNAEEFSEALLGGAHLGKPMRYRGSVAPIGAISLQFDAIRSELKVSCLYGIC